jgi:cobalt-zinc-cadmium efflux system outer membrane protein
MKKNVIIRYAAMSAAVLLALCIIVRPSWTQGTPAGPTQLNLDQAIELALEHSPALKATRTQIDQSKAQEITANLRPNPVLSWDSQFIPIFNPSLFSVDTVNNLQQFDVGVGYLFERGHKRYLRLQSARDQTAVVASQVGDTERTMKFNVAQQFIAALLAKSQLEFAIESLHSFEQTVQISTDRYQAGDISQGDLLKIKLQLLQFRTDVSSAQIARVQALGSLRQLIGFDAVPADFDVAGDLVYEPVHAGLQDLQAIALRERPDLQAARQGIQAANSQFILAKANGKQDLNVSMNYSHVSGNSSTSLFFNFPLAIFNRNQGEIARTRYVITQEELSARAAEEAVFTDVRNVYEATRTDAQVVQLYESGYLKNAKESRDISEFAYKQGAAALLDFLDAERSYRSSQLAYRQALAAHMLSVEQLREAVGIRTLP